jgi:hypothetical protein
MKSLVSLIVIIYIHIVLAHHIISLLQLEYYHLLSISIFNVLDKKILYGIFN